MIKIEITKDAKLYIEDLRDFIATGDAIFVNGVRIVGSDVRITYDDEVKDEQPV